MIPECITFHDTLSACKFEVQYTYNILKSTVNGNGNISRYHPKYPWVTSQVPSLVLWKNLGSTIGYLYSTAGYLGITVGYLRCHRHWLVYTHALYTYAHVQYVSLQLVGSQ
jgi:hypothetical protein